MTEHHRSTENHSRRVRLVRAHNVLGSVTASRLVQGKLTANVRARHNARSTNKGCANVRYNVTVQVGHDHDIKLVRAANKLHRCVVDDHVIRLDAGTLVLFRDATERVEEQTIPELHDVRLVHTGHLLAVVFQRKVESEAHNTLSLEARRHLEGFHNTW